MEAFEDACEDYLVVGVTLGVNRSTARSIIATFLRDCRMEERPRCGSNNVKVDEEMKSSTKIAFLHSLKLTKN